MNKKWATRTGHNDAVWELHSAKYYKVIRIKLNFRRNEDGAYKRGTRQRRGDEATLSCEDTHRPDQAQRLKRTYVK